MDKPQKFNYEATVDSVYTIELEKYIAYLEDQLVDARGLKNRDKYFDSLNRSYIKGKN